MEFVSKILLLLLLVFFTFENRAMGGAAEDAIVEEITGRREMVKWAGYGEDKLSTVTITGKILCQAATSRKYSGHRIPVSGASVAVWCGRAVKNKKSLVNGRSDRHGEFIIDLPSRLHAIPSLETTCLVKLRRVPRGSPCGESFTGENATLRLAHRDEGARWYTTGTLYLRPIHRKNQIPEEGAAATPLS